MPDLVECLLLFSKMFLFHIGFRDKTIWYNHIVYFLHVQSENILEASRRFYEARLYLPAAILKRSKVTYRRERDVRPFLAS